MFSRRTVARPLGVSPKILPPLIWKCSNQESFLGSYSATRVAVRGSILERFVPLWALHR